MKNIKHSKYKNTILLFDLLSKQVAWDVLSENNTRSVNILNKYFKKNSELRKEYKCYSTIINFNTKSEYKANKLLEKVISNYKKIDSKQLSKEKYQLVGEIKKKYDLDSFFSTKVPYYKVYASLYKIFENVKRNNDVTFSREYDTVIEFLTGKFTPQQNQEVHKGLKILELQDPTIKKAASNLLIKRFNEKYNNLNKKQKILLSKYINENISLPPFKNYILDEANYIKGEMLRLSNKINDKNLKIKLRNIASLTENIITAKNIEENHLSSMLKYYELIDTVEKISNKNI